MVSACSGWRRSSRGVQLVDQLFVLEPDLDALQDLLGEHAREVAHDRAIDRQHDRDARHVRVVGHQPRHDQWGEENDDVGNVEAGIHAHRGHGAGDPAADDHRQEHLLLRGQQREEDQRRTGAEDSAPERGHEEPPAPSLRVLLDDLDLRRAPKQDHPRPERHERGAGPESEGHPPHPGDDHGRDEADYDDYREGVADRLLDDEVQPVDPPPGLSLRRRAPRQGCRSDALVHATSLGRASSTCPRSSRRGGSPR